MRKLLQFLLLFLPWSVPPRALKAAFGYQIDRTARIGRGNWITGFPLGGTRHFLHEPDRAPELHVGTHAAITNRHLIDCTNRVHLGAFSTFAGFRSQILTHSIDLGSCRQSSAPVRIGRYCFVGTGCTLLAASSLPDFSENVAT